MTDQEDLDKVAESCKQSIKSLSNTVSSLESSIVAAIAGFTKRNRMDIVPQLQSYIPIIEIQKSIIQEIISYIDKRDFYSFKLGSERISAYSSLIKAEAQALCDELTSGVKHEKIIH